MKIWKCKCGYSITDLQYLSMKADLLCPSCNYHYLSDFSSKRIFERNNDEQKQ
jgi:hypothetical protein